MKLKQLTIALICCSGTLAWSMQPLDDAKLSQMTGQDGITIGVELDAIAMQHLAVIDTDGLTTANYGNRSGFVIAGNSSDKDISLTFNGAAANQSTFNAVIDSDGGANNDAYVNIKAGFGSHITGLEISPFAIYMAGNTAISSPTVSNSIFNGTALKDKVSAIFRLHDAMKINFVSGQAPQANIQLGHAPQGQMIRYSGAIASICGTATDPGCRMQIVDDSSAVESGIGFNLQMNASESSGFLLDSFYTSINADGVVFGNVGQSSAFDARLNKITIGNLPQTPVVSTGVFKGTANGTLGSIGMKGMTVENMKMKVSGF